MKGKNAAKIIIFCVIFLFLLNRIYTVFSWKDTSSGYYSSMNSFYALEDDVVDVLFLGSSHCYCSVIPAQLWEDYGMASFNMAISGQDLASSYYCIEEALKTQDLKVVCVDLYGCTYHGYQVEGNLYRNTLSRKLSLTSIEAAYAMVETDNEADFILKWPIIHTRYRELAKQDFLTESPAYLGYFAQFNVNPVAEVGYLNAEPSPIGEQEQEWLKKMIELTRGNNVEIVFFLAPYQAAQWAQANIEYAKDMLAEYNVPVIDMVELDDEVGIDWEQDFLDWGHTNYYGAQKVTSYLGEFLKKNYSLEDHSGDERYAVWEEDVKVRQHEVQNDQIVRLVTVESYLDTMSWLEDYTVVISTSGEYVSGEKSIAEYIETVGIYEGFYETGGVWILNNRECVFKSGEENMIHSMELTYDDLLVANTNGVKKVVVNKDIYQKVENGINILVYDNVIGTVVDSVGFDAMYQYGIVR